MVNSSEHWDEFLIENGDILCVKRVMKRIYQIKDQTSDGQPMYYLQDFTVSDVLGKDEYPKEASK